MGAGWEGRDACDGVEGGEGGGDGVAGAEHLEDIVKHMGLPLNAQQWFEILKRHTIATSQHLKYLQPSLFLATNMTMKP